MLDPRSLNIEVVPKDAPAV